jgi:hypothetical protein
MRRLIKILLIFGLICSAPAAAEGWWLFAIPPAIKSLKQWYDSPSKPETKPLVAPARGARDLADQSSSAILGADQWLAHPKALREAANPQRDAAKAQEVKPEGESSLQCLREAGFDTTSSSYQLCVKNIK